MSTTGNTIIRRSLRLLNVVALGQSVPAPMAQEARAELNGMLSLWGQQAITIPAVTIFDGTTVANQGGPSNPYTIGPGGDFDTTKPPNQNSLIGAQLLLGNTSPVVGVPLAILTDAAYDAISIKELTSAQYTCVYYNPTYAGGLGTINLYPVPTSGDNDLRLYLELPIAAFADLTTSYDLPDGYEDAIVYNLAVRIAPMFGRSALPETQQQALMGWDVITTATRAKLSDLAVDPMWLQGGDPRYGFNIQTGNM